MKTSIKKTALIIGAIGCLTFGHAQKTAHLSFDSLISLMPETKTATEAAQNFLKGLEQELIAMQTEMDNKYKDSNKDYNPFFKYSGLGVQLLITIGFGVWVGLKIDSYMGNKQPWAAIICSLLFMITGIVVFIKSLPKV